jgi:hypothetical protein
MALSMDFSDPFINNTSVTNNLDKVYFDYAGMSNVDSWYEESNELVKSYLTKEDIIIWKYIIDPDDKKPTIESTKQLAMLTKNVIAHKKEFQLLIGSSVPDKRDDDDEKEKLHIELLKSLANINYTGIRRSKLENEYNRYINYKSVIIKLENQQRLRDKKKKEREKAMVWYKQPYIIAGVGTALVLVLPAVAIFFMTPGMWLNLISIVRSSSYLFRLFTDLMRMLEIFTLSEVGVLNVLFKNLKPGNPIVENKIAELILYQHKLDRANQIVTAFSIKTDGTPIGDAAALAAEELLKNAINDKESFGKECTAILAAMKGDPLFQSYFVDGLFVAAGDPYVEFVTFISKVFIEKDFITDWTLTRAVFVSTSMEFNKTKWIDMMYKINHVPTIRALATGLGLYADMYAYVDFTKSMFDKGVDSGIIYKSAARGIVYSSSVVGGLHEGVGSIIGYTRGNVDSLLKLGGLSSSFNLNIPFIGSYTDKQLEQYITFSIENLIHAQASGYVEGYFQNIEKQTITSTSPGGDGKKKDKDKKTDVEVVEDRINQIVLHKKDGLDNETIFDLIYGSEQKNEERFKLFTYFDIFQNTNSKLLFKRPDLYFYSMYTSIAASISFDKVAKVALSGILFKVVEESIYTGLPHTELTFIPKLLRDLFGRHIIDISLRIVSFKFGISDISIKRYFEQLRIKLVDDIIHDTGLFISKCIQFIKSSVIDKITLGRYFEKALNHWSVQMFTYIANFTYNICLPLAKGMFRAGVYNALEHPLLTTDVMKTLNDPEKCKGLFMFMDIKIYNIVNGMANLDIGQIISDVLDFGDIDKILLNNVIPYYDITDGYMKLKKLEFDSLRGASLIVPPLIPTDLSKNYILIAPEISSNNKDFMSIDFDVLKDTFDKTTNVVGPKGKLKFDDAILLYYYSRYKEDTNKNPPDETFIKWLGKQRDSVWNGIQTEPLQQVKSLEFALLDRLYQDRQLDLHLKWIDTGFWLKLPVPVVQDQLGVDVKKKNFDTFSTTPSTPLRHPGDEIEDFLKDSVVNLLTPLSLGDVYRGADIEVSLPVPLAFLENSRHVQKKYKTSDFFAVFEALSLITPIETDLLEMEIEIQIEIKHNSTLRGLYNRLMDSFRPLLNGIMTDIARKLEVFKQAFDITRNIGFRNMGFDYKLFNTICIELVKNSIGNEIGTMIKHKDVQKFILSKADFTHVCCTSGDCKFLEHGIDINNGEPVPMTGCEEKDKHTFTPEQLYQILYRPEVISSILLSDIKSTWFNNNKKTKDFAQEIQSLFQGELMDMIKETLPKEPLNCVDIDDKTEHLQKTKCQLMNDFKKMFDIVVEKNKLNSVYQTTMFEYFTGSSNKRNKLLDTIHFSEYKTHAELCATDIDTLKAYIQPKTLSSLNFNYPDPDVPGTSIVYSFKVDEEYSMQKRIIENRISAEFSCSTQTFSALTLSELCANDNVRKCIDNMNMLLDEQLENAKRREINNLRENMTAVFDNFKNTSALIKNFMGIFEQRIKEFHRSMKEVKNPGKSPQVPGNPVKEPEKEEGKKNQSGNNQQLPIREQQEIPLRSDLKDAVDREVRNKAAEVKEAAEVAVKTDFDMSPETGDYEVSVDEDMCNILDEDYLLQTSFQNMLSFLGGAGKSISDRFSRERDSPKIDVQSQVTEGVKIDDGLTDEQKHEKCKMYKDNWKWRYLGNRNELTFIGNNDEATKIFITNVCNKKNLTLNFFDSINFIYETISGFLIGGAVAGITSLVTLICQVFFGAGGTFCGVFVGYVMSVLANPSCIVYAIHYGIYTYFRSTEKNNKTNNTLGNRLLIGMWAQMYWSFNEYQIVNHSSNIGICEGLFSSRNIHIGRIGPYLQEVIGELSGGGSWDSENKFGNINLGDEMTSGELAALLANGSKDVLLNEEEEKTYLSVTSAFDNPANKLLYDAGDEQFCVNMNFKQYKNLLKILFLKTNLAILYSYVFCTFTGIPYYNMTNLQNDIQAVFKLLTDAVVKAAIAVVCITGAWAAAYAAALALYKNPWTALKVANASSRVSSPLCVGTLLVDLWNSLKRTTLGKIINHIFYNFTDIMKFFSDVVDLMLDNEIIRKIILLKFFGSETKPGKRNPIRDMIEFGIKNFDDKKKKITPQPPPETPQYIAALEQLKNEEFRDQFYNDVKTEQGFRNVYYHIKESLFNMVGISRVSTSEPMPVYMWFKDKLQQNQVGIPIKDLTCQLITSIRLTYDNVSLDADKLYIELEKIMGYDKNTNTCNPLITTTEGNIIEKLIDFEESIYLPLDKNNFGNYDCCANNIKLVVSKPTHFLEDDTNPNYGIFDRDKTLPCNELNNIVTTNRSNIKEILQYAVFDKKFNDMIENMIFEKIMKGNILGEELVLTDDKYKVLVKPCNKGEVLVLDLKNPCLLAINPSDMDNTPITFNEYDDSIKNTQLITDKLYSSITSDLEKSGLYFFIPTESHGDFLDNLYQYSKDSIGLSYNDKKIKLEEIFKNVNDIDEEKKGGYIKKILEKSLPLNELALQQLDPKSSNDDMFISAILSVLNLHPLIKSRLNNVYALIIYLRDIKQNKTPPPDFPECDFIDPSTRTLIIELLNEKTNVEQKIFGYLYKNFLATESDFNIKHWDVKLGPAEAYVEKIYGNKPSLTYEDTEEFYSKGYTQYVTPTGEVYLTKNNVSEYVDIDMRDMDELNKMNIGSFVSDPRSRKRKLLPSIVFSPDNSRITISDNKDVKDAYECICSPVPLKGCVWMLKADIQRNTEMFTNYDKNKHASDLLGISRVSKNGNMRSLNDFRRFVEKVLNNGEFKKKYNFMFSPDSFVEQPAADAVVDLGKKVLGRQVMSKVYKSFVIDYSSREYSFQGSKEDWIIAKKLVSYWLLMNGSEMKDFPKKTSYLETLKLKTTGKSLSELGKNTDVSFQSLSVMDNYNLNGDITYDAARFTFGIHPDQIQKQ